MNAEILSTLLQASGAAGVTGLFVSYLTGKDKRDQEMVKAFNNTINSHLRQETKSKEMLARRLQEFTDTNRELKQTLEQVYIWNKDLADENKKIKNT